MAIDYQQILMEMNRPRRRQGSSLWKTLAVALLAIALVGGCGYAIWRFNVVGLVGSAWRGTVELASGLFAGKAAAQPEEGVQLDVAAANQAASAPSGGSRSAAPSGASPAVPAPDGPISVAAAASSAPSRAPAAAAAVKVPEAHQAMAAAPAAGSLRPSGAPAAGPDMAPPPALSDAKAQIRAVDQMLSSNPAEALRRIEDLMKTKLADDDAAEAGYRLGYAARMVRDEEKAEKSWRETAEKWPTLRGGRYSALAVADTWFRRYAGERSQLSFWDDIQIMYSRVLGQDDAPFLPDAVKAGVKANLKRLNDALFFGPAPTKLARYHKVEPGELLGTIANKYRVDYDSIARINGVNPNRIGAGLDLKLVVGEVSIVVRKNEKDPNRTPTVTWFLDGRWAREYPACVGDGLKTPAGTYQVSSKEKDPSWTNPVNGQLLPNSHPENILGSRWMAIKGMNTQGLGIHGTTVDDSIPGYTSAGCVRLLNKDVEELFSFARLGVKVTILD